MRVSLATRRHAKYMKNSSFLPGPNNESYGYFSRPTLSLVACQVKENPRKRSPTVGFRARAIKALDRLVDPGHRCCRLSPFHGDFSYHPFTYFTCCEAIAEVGHLELIFISCPYLLFLRKNSWSRVKTNSKGVPVMSIHVHELSSS